MSSNIGSELVSFHHFLVEKLDRNEGDLSPEEALDMWRAENPLAEERDDATAELKKALDDMAAGDHGIPFEDFERDFRKRNGLGSRQ